MRAPCISAGESAQARAETLRAGAVTRGDVTGGRGGGGVTQASAGSAGFRSGICNKLQ